MAASAAVVSTASAISPVNFRDMSLVPQEPEHPLPSQGEPSMTTSSPSPERIWHQKLCIATLMDAHPDAFAPPSCGTPWVELVRRGFEPNGQERRVIDKALGMISAVFRSAQMVLGDVPTLGQQFAADKSGLTEAVEADSIALALIGDDATEDPESMALARSVTLYKRAADAGLIDRAELSRHMEAALDEQPVHTALAYDTKMAAKYIASLEVEYLLGPRGTVQ
jgi:hypothetical protein